MSPVALSSLLTLAAVGVSMAAAQVTGTYPATPLASKRYPSPSALVRSVIPFILCVSKTKSFFLAV